MTLLWPIFPLEGLRLGYYQNEREAGSESIPQWRLGSFGGTGFERRQAKGAGQYHCCALGYTSDHNIVVLRHFCLELLLVLSLQAIPSAFALLIPTQIPTRFGNFS